MKKNERTKKRTLSIELTSNVLRVASHMTPNLTGEIMTTVAKSARDLNVYKIAFDAAIRIHELTKSFPSEEKYSLTDQIRRSSRSVCANLAEGWRKKKYEAYFVNKLRDSSQEAAETQVWLDFAFRFNYLSKTTLDDLNEEYEHIFAMLMTMEKMTRIFCK